MRPTDRRRRGFTLVELLVAAALALVVMTVLSLAFQTGLQTLSQLKSVVGLAEQMRSAEAVFRRDLGAAHLEAGSGSPVRVSRMKEARDANDPPSRGYFHFIQGGFLQPSSGPPVSVGPYAEFRGQGDETGLRSFRTQSAQGVIVQTGVVPYPSTDTPTPVGQLFGRAWMDTLNMTVKLAGDKPQEVFAAPAEQLLPRLQAIDARDGLGALPVESRSADPTARQLTSRWAEVSYFLMPAGPPGVTTPTVFTSDEGGVRQLPLYTLYRRQRVLADRTISSDPAGGPPTTPITFGQPEAQASRGVATAQWSATAGPLAGRWKVCGPEALAGFSLATTPAQRQQEVEEQKQSRLGGKNDPLSKAPFLPDISGLPNGTTARTLRDDLEQRGYPVPAGGEFGSDILMTNVLSMTVRPVYGMEVDAVSAARVQTFVNANPSRRVVPVLSNPGMVYPADQNAYSPRNMPEPLTASTGPTPAFPIFFDTSGGGFTPVFRDERTNEVLNSGPGSIGFTTPPRIEEFRLKAVEVKLRVYDAKNKTSRQMTIVQDL